MLTTNINILSVLAAALCSMILGFIWYSPLVFGKPWIRSLGKDPDNKEEMAVFRKNSGKLYGPMFLSVIVGMITLAIVLRSIGANTFYEALSATFILWLGFIATLKYADTLFAERSKTLALIDAGFQLISLLSAAIIFILLG